MGMAQTWPVPVLSGHVLSPGPRSAGGVVSESCLRSTGVLEKWGGLSHFPFLQIIGFRGPCQWLPTQNMMCNFGSPPPLAKKGPLETGRIMSLFSVVLLCHWPKTKTATPAAVMF